LANEAYGDGSMALGLSPSRKALQSAPLSLMNVADRRAVKSSPLFKGWPGMRVTPARPFLDPLRLCRCLLRVERVASTVELKAGKAGIAPSDVLL
jgi:hypothetical protein